MEDFMDLSQMQDHSAAAIITHCSLYHENEPTLELYPWYVVVGRSS
jgi:hypothetical protein